MIGFENVSKFILSDITLHISKGISVGVVGPVGAGKTTLLRLACGILRAETGNVFINGNSQADFSKGVSKEIGVLFTDKQILNGEESVISNFMTLKSIYRLSEEQFEGAYKKLSGRLGFDVLEDEKVKNLSLGQRRRVEIAAVLLHNPKILILDEPTNGLDENAKETFRELINEYTERGTTVLLSSHDILSISNICKRIVILCKGELLYYGKEDILLKQFVPIDIMELKIKGSYPDLEDLPLETYYLENDVMTIVYNSNHISSAEILKNILPQTQLDEVKIYKPDLTDAILKIQKGQNDE